MAKALKLTEILADGGTQTRETLNFRVIEQYAEAMRRGEKFPPVDVFEDTAGNRWLADGFHRHQAACAAELESIAATIHKGEKRDALWFALSANNRNGLHRTDGDKRRAVEIALSDGLWKDLNDEALAKHIGVGKSLVHDVRSQFSAAENSPEPIRRKGKDGKNYPATKKRKLAPKPEPVEEPEEEFDEHDADEALYEDVQSDLRQQATEQLNAFAATVGMLGIDCDTELTAIRVKLVKFDKQTA